MRVVLSDWDGVWFSSEVAKAVRWYFSAMCLKGDPEISQAFIEQIAKRNPEARKKSETLIESRWEDIQTTMQFSGGRRIDFAMRTYHHFIDPNADEKLVEEKMYPLAEPIREILIEWFSTPIFENLKFFERLAMELDRTYWDKHPLGLITQTESSALDKQFNLSDTSGRNIWGKFRNLLSRFGPYIPGKGFPHTECAGDYKEKFPHLKGKEKTTAYKILCAKKGVRPEETITFEDTEDGVRAAKGAGIVCIGIKPINSNQDLYLADLVITGSLECLIDFVDLFVFEDSQKVIERIKEFLP